MHLHICEQKECFDTRERTWTISILLTSYHEEWKHKISTLDRSGDKYLTIGVHKKIYYENKKPFQNKLIWAFSSEHLLNKTLAGCCYTSLDVVRN